MSNSIWSTLSTINVNEWIEKKGQFSYLSWTQAWAAVKREYPQSRYNLCPDIIYPDGTMEVRVEVLIPDDGDGLLHEMWLPVLNFQNKAIANPNAMDINTARMRCLVKCLAMFGLGHYIYAGESLPQAPTFTAEQKAKYVALMAASDGWGLKAFGKEVGNDIMTALFNAAPDGQKTKQKKICSDLVTEANVELKASLTGIQEALDTQSADSVVEILDECVEIERKFVIGGLTEVQLQQMVNLGIEV